MLKNIFTNVTAVMVAACLFFSLATFAEKSAYAVPSFGHQTGLSCSVCHTVFPELTPFGRTFKMNGFTFSNQTQTKGYTLPISGMLELSHTMLKDNDGILNNGIAPFDNPEDTATERTNLPQQASVFYGGLIYGEHTGALAQLTYDGTANSIALDLTDIRYANTTKIGDKDTAYGLTLNNAPGVEDLWNSTPIWGFPFATSAVAPTPAAGTLIDGALATQVGGIGAYGYWNDLIYAGVSVYRTTFDGITRPLGAGSTPTMVTDGAVPYWRLALAHNWDKHNIEIGTYGLKADIFPGGASKGSTDKFTDTALDAQYQFIGDPHLLTLRTTWIHEKQELDASFNQGLSANDSNTLQTFKLNGSYYYRSPAGDIGGSLGYFQTTGNKDTLLYVPDPVVGSQYSSPDTKGYLLELDYVLKQQYKFSLQYIIYAEFNGAHTDYDGSGRNAQDNNTLYLLAWLMF